MRTRETQRPARKQSAIMRATLAELARSDYGGLSIEHVAARARVNKTTVYRHWPTKAALVRSALSSVADAHEVGPSSGSLRRDLVRMARMMVDFASSSEGQSLMRLRLLDNPEPELAAIASALQKASTDRRTAVIREAIARGEVRSDVDPALVLALLGGALHLLLFVKKQAVTDALIRRIVDLVLDGAKAPRAARGRRRAVSAP